MIPTLSRYSPMKPSTSAQPALPLSTNPTPSTAVHQRSGLTFDEYQSMSGEYKPIKYLISSFKNPNSRNYSTLNTEAILDKLKSLLSRGQLYIHCLKQEGFLGKSLDEQWAIINAFHTNNMIEPSSGEKEEINTALNKIPNSGTQNTLQNLIFFTDLVKTLQKEIEKLPTKRNRETPYPPHRLARVCATIQAWLPWPSF